MRSNQPRLPKDDAARQVIRDRRDLNLLVEAGAGSGKTQGLAERMARGIAAGAYDVATLVAVTFTRKAASELRGRFHAELERLLRGRAAAGRGGADDPETERLRRALANLDAFFAGTIHAFCARLLRERPVEAGVSPGFRELEEDEDERWRRQALRGQLYARRSAGDPRLTALLAAEVRTSDLDAVFDRMCMHEDATFPPGPATVPDGVSAWRALVEALQQLDALRVRPVSDETRCPVQQLLFAQLRTAADIGSRTPSPSVLARMMAAWERTTLAPTATWWIEGRTAGQALRPQIERAIGRVQSVTGPYTRARRQYVYALAVDLLQDVRAAVADERRRANRLNYGDLLTRTAAVLRRDPETRAALQRKCQVLFVDEFQDTDPMQAEILFWLAEADTLVTRRTTEWWSVALRPGALFVVGDPKQSIYRFRRADIALYDEIRRRFEEDATCDVVELTENFRSTPAVCAFANQVFEPAFGRAARPVQAGYTPLVAHQEQTESSAVVVLEHQGRPTAGGDAVAEDADRIADVIAAERRAAPDGTVRWSDFLILTLRVKHLQAYAEALTARGIPVEVTGAGAFVAGDIGRDMVRLLRALADERDALATVSVLRGPLCGLSDQALFAHVAAGGTFGPAVPVGLGTPDVRAALERLGRYRAQRRRLPLPALLEQLVDESGWLAIAATTPAGREAADLLLAIDLVRRVCEAGGSAADAADRLEAVLEDHAAVDAVPLEPGHGDVVRVMNLHKAKGLEARVVFLADPTHGLQPRVEVRIVRTGEQVQGWTRVTEQTEWFQAPILGAPEDWPIHEQAERPYQDAEAVRLHYVAATRPKERLLVSRWTQDRSNAWDTLTAHLVGGPTVAAPAAPPAIPPALPDVSPVVFAAAAAERARRQSAVTVASWEVETATGAAESAAQRLAGDRRDAPMGGDDDSPDDHDILVEGTGHAPAVGDGEAAAQGALGGREWGTLVHALLEHRVRHPEATDEDLRLLGRWLATADPSIAGLVDAAVALVAACAARGVLDAALQAAERSVETPFGFSDRPRHIVIGVIDLAYRDQDGWHLVDYKTDGDLAARRAKYDEQLAVYAQALERVQVGVASRAIVPIRAVAERPSGGV